MFKILFCSLLFVLLQACQSKLEHDDSNNKPNLKQAARYNAQLGLTYLKQGSRVRAKKKLLLALNQSPNSAQVNAAMAYYFEQSNELEQAKQYYRRALSLSANSGAQLNNYGTFLCRQGYYQQALAYFLKAVKDINYLHTSGAYENAGLCSLAIPDYQKARFFFSEALKHDPSRTESLYELVKLEHLTGKDAEALNQLKKYSNLVRKNKIFLSLAIPIARKSGDVDFLNSLLNQVPVDYSRA